MRKPGPPARLLPRRAGRDSRLLDHGGLALGFNIENLLRERRWNEVAHCASRSRRRVRVPPGVRSQPLSLVSIRPLPSTNATSTSYVYI